MRRADYQRLISRMPCSNHPLPASFVYRESRIYHQAHVRFKGSPVLRNHSDLKHRQGFRIYLNPENPLRDVSTRRSYLSPHVRGPATFEITTNEGGDITTQDMVQHLQGKAPYDIEQILIENNGRLVGIPVHCRTRVIWQAELPLTCGKNHVKVLAFNQARDEVAAPGITVDCVGRPELTIEPPEVEMQLCKEGKKIEFTAIVSEHQESELTCAWTASDGVIIEPAGSPFAVTAKFTLPGIYTVACTVRHDFCKDNSAEAQVVVSGCGELIYTGDANCDDSIEISDVVSILSCLFGSSGSRLGS